ncbi:MAG TPA: hypothetical protein VK790_13230 [Solirubrobacteraceae bacterium]|jgi:hypothetical protein|nr:hypothetical protein [Solirubrobacteraceae bacterium]
MSRMWRVLALLLAPVALIGAVALAVPVAALAGEAGATWRSEQPPPPPPSPGVEPSSVPIPLGHVGDMEFLAANRGLLITAGNGSTVLPGVWAYDGAGWKELAIVCGATDGRIAWSGQDEFWTVSDGRAGQTHSNGSGKQAPLADNTLCHFAGGQVVASYASVAFQPTSYEAIHAAGCLGPEDCWFAGESLSTELPVTGSFHLHWNGSSLLEEPYEGESQPVEDMRAFDGRLYESVRVRSKERTEEEPPVLHTISPAGVSPTFEGIPGVRNQLESEDVPLYETDETTEALEALHLSTDEGSLWAAAGPVPPSELPEGEPGQVTISRFSKSEGVWRQLIGPSTTPSGLELLPNDVVDAIAAEPGGEGAWVALGSTNETEQASPGALATVVHVAANGTVSQLQSLPSSAEQEHGANPEGEASRLVCPAAHDCWLSTTQGWLFHLTTGEESLPVDDEGFSSLIANRPADQGLLQLPPDAPPEEQTLPGELTLNDFSQSTKPLVESRVAVPLLSNLHSRLVRGSTLELRFHLAVKARVRLLAKRKRSTVASTPTRVLAAGNRKLMLRLDPHRWPTKLDLQTHALAPLPTVSSRSPSVETISTRASFPRTLQATPGSLF